RAPFHQRADRDEREDAERDAGDGDRVEAPPRRELAKQNEEVKPHRCRTREPSRSAPSELATTTSPAVNPATIAVRSTSRMPVLICWRCACPSMTVQISS